MQAAFLQIVDKFIKNFFMMRKEKFQTLFIYSFYLIISSKICSGAHYQYEACVPTNCGDGGPSISFPFYVPAVQESYCGYPKFEINCSNGLPILHLSDNGGSGYIVEHIIYENRTVRVFNVLALLEVGSDGDCPPRIKNMTLPRGIFDYAAATASFHLLSGCRNNVSEELSGYEVRCGGSRERSNGSLGMYEGDVNLGRALENCEENVVAPVGIWGGGERGDGGVDVAEVLRRGFDMNWVASDCNACRESGGRCGFNESSFHFRCFCPERPHSRSCKPGKQKRSSISPTLLSYFSHAWLYSSSSCSSLSPSISSPLSANSNCPQSFDCGDFSLEFPFTVTSSPGCGLITVDGCDDSAARKTIRGSEFAILNKTSSNKFLVRESTLDGFLEDRSCLFKRNLTLPQVVPLSFTYSPNITFFTCFNKSSDARIQEYFANYSLVSRDGTGCPSDFATIYYNNQTARMEGTDIPTDCLMIQLPVRSGAASDVLLSMITPNFTLEWNVPDGCSRSKSGNDYDCIEEKTRFKRIIVIGCATMAALASTLTIMFVLIRRKRAMAKQEQEKDIELFVKNNGNLAPMKYKYSTIKKMTNSFSENLGRGGFGSVFKGMFPDGRLVAVKLLNESNANGENFMNEVASISRTSHINIVSLLGFCFEGSKRALIFDFMPNGSLEKFIGNTVESGLGWDKLFEIALGIARGLEYLHQGCNTRILHLDIKPQNILLDKDLNPRISDFGLAKLCPNRSSIVSMTVARGTIGYIAPEVFSRNFGEVSYKSDVYSYGMLVLEMVGGRRAIDRREVDRTSEIYFPDYIYKQLEEDAVRDSVHVGTMGEGESLVVRRNLMIVGLWCIQTNPKDRPSMTKVVETLEGKLGSLEVPPKPHLYSPPRSALTFSASESL